MCHARYDCWKSSKLSRLAEPVTPSPVKKQVQATTTRNTILGKIPLTLSCPGGALGGHLAVAIHISPNNGPIEMVPNQKLVVDVLAVHWTP
jgi:hypothetical protein